jgi:8-oxo-dGTP diphosphatase
LRPRPTIRFKPTTVSATDHHASLKRAGKGPGRVRIGVVGVIERGGRVLLCQRRDDETWEAPGGLIDGDEDLLACLHREVLEEAGIYVLPCGISGVYCSPASGEAERVLTVVWRCKPLGNPPEDFQSPETTAVKWFNIDEVAAVCVDYRAVRISRAVNPISGAEYGVI